MIIMSRGNCRFKVVAVEKAVDASLHFVLLGDNRSTSLFSPECLPWWQKKGRHLPRPTYATWIQDSPQVVVGPYGSLVSDKSCTEMPTI